MSKLVCNQAHPRRWGAGKTPTQQEEQLAWVVQVSREHIHNVHIHLQPGHSPLSDRPISPQDSFETQGASPSRFWVQVPRIVYIHEVSSSPSHSRNPSKSVVRPRRRLENLGIIHRTWNSYVTSHNHISKLNNRYLSQQEKTPST